MPLRHGRPARALRALRLERRLGLVGLVGLVVGLLACRSPAGPTRPADAAVPDVDATVTAALADGYATYAGRQATLRCACAADQPFCLATERATLDAPTRACVGAAAARDVAAFTATLDCLDAALDTHDTCAAGLVCADVAARAACRDAYEGAGEACLTTLPTGQVLALLACFVADAGP